MRMVSPFQMKEIEDLSEKYGVSKAQLMENAGRGLAEHIMKKCPEGGKTVFLAGSGNNGGDCFAAARILDENGFRATVINLLGKPRTEISSRQFELLGNTKVEIIKGYHETGINSQVQAAELEYMTNSDENTLTNIQYEESRRVETVLEAINSADVIVDGVFGTGFHGSLDSEIAMFFAAGKEKAYRIAADIPSGGDAETGETAEGVFKADMTLSFGAVKAGMSQFPLYEYCGDIVCQDIGIPTEAYVTTEDTREYFRMEHYEWKQAKRIRSTTAHKGDFGKLLCICGSSSMRGAACLSTLAALRSGAGLVTLASVEKAIDAAVIHAPEALFCELYQDERGFMLFEENADIIAEQLKKADAVLIGCGMGVTEDTAALTRFVIENAECPLIIDADGINCASADINMLMNSKADIILTPHAGEMARLLSCDVSEVNSYRFSAANELAEHCGVTVLLKGAGTITADSERTYVNINGNPGMSCGGSGDVLAGIITALAAQGFSAIDAARFGAYLHGRAGDMAAIRLGQEFMLPRDIINNLSAAVK